MKRIKPSERALVLIHTKTNDYVRYVGKNSTDHLKSDQPLDAALIEQFRTDPNSVYDDEEGDSCA